MLNKERRKELNCLGSLKEFTLEDVKFLAEGNEKLEGWLISACDRRKDVYSFRYINGLDYMQGFKKLRLPTYNEEKALIQRLLLEGAQSVLSTDVFEGEEGQITLTPNNILTKYYRKTLSVKLGKNQPSVAKQLQKQGVKATQKELQAFTECFEWLATDPEAGLYIDLIDNRIDPEYKGRWAFQGSCHRNGCAGENTPEVLKEMGFDMLKVYKSVEGSGEDAPFARAYYYTEDGEVAHSGMYSFSWLETCQSFTTLYQTATLLLCLVFGKRVDDFSKIEGVIHMPHEQNYVWFNGHEEASYSKYGTAELFSGLEYDGEYSIETVWSEMLSEYIPEEEAVYCGNIDSYVHKDDAVECIECGDMVYTESDCYRTRNGYCCGYDCVELYYEIECL